MTRPRRPFEAGVADPVLDVEMLEVLREIRDLLRRSLEQARPARGILSRSDRARLSRLLPAIAGAYGSERFTARDLFEADAAPAVRLVVRGLNPRRVGRLFQRADQQAVDGYLVQRDGVELHAVLWRIQRVPEFPHSAVPPRATGNAV